MIEIEINIRIYYAENQNTDMLCGSLWDHLSTWLRSLHSTSLRCRWRTRATRCLTPTVLYTDVDGQCDKLVTDDRHQFITLTIHLSRQHLRRSIDVTTLPAAVPELWLVLTKI